MLWFLHSELLPSNIYPTSMFEVNMPNAFQNILLTKQCQWERQREGWNKRMDIALSLIDKILMLSCAILISQALQQLLI